MTPSEEVRREIIGYMGDTDIEGAHNEGDVKRHLQKQGIYVAFNQMYMVYIDRDKPFFQAQHEPHKLAWKLNQRGMAAYLGLE